MAWNLVNVMLHYMHVLFLTFFHSSSHVKFFYVWLILILIEGAPRTSTQTSRYPTKICTAHYIQDVYYTSPQLQWHYIWPSFWCIISSKTRTATVPCLHRNNSGNQKHFKGKLYDKLGLESLQLLCWYRKLTSVYKLFNTESLLKNLWLCC